MALYYSLLNISANPNKKRKIAGYCSAHAWVMLSEEDAAVARSLRKRRNIPHAYSRTSLKVFICTHCNKGFEAGVTLCEHVESELVSPFFMIFYPGCLTDIQTDTDIRANMAIGNSLLIREMNICCSRIMCILCCRILILRKWTEVLLLLPRYSGLHRTLLHAQANLTRHGSIAYPYCMSPNAELHHNRDSMIDH